MLNNILYTANLITSILVVLGASIGFLVGLRRYTAARRWEVHQYLAKEMDRFFAMPEIQKALSMLDWNSRPILLFPHKSNPDDRFKTVNNDVIYGALDPDPGRAYNEVEGAIRDIFDKLFMELTRHHAHISANAFKFKDYYLYLFYWLEILHSGRPMKNGHSLKNMEFVERLQEFLAHYGYDGVLELIELYAKESKRKRQKLKSE